MIPTLKQVKLKEFGYLPVGAKVTNGTVSYVAGRFYVSVVVDIDEKIMWGEIMDFIDTLEPYSKDTKFITNIPTKSGWHLITTPFNIMKFKEAYPDIDVKKNNPTLLYCL